MNLVAIRTCFVANVFVCLFLYIAIVKRVVLIFVNAQYRISIIIIIIINLKQYNKYVLAHERDSEIYLKKEIKITFRPATTYISFL